MRICYNVLLTMGCFHLSSGLKSSLRFVILMLYMMSEQEKPVNAESEIPVPLIHLQEEYQLRQGNQRGQIGFLQIFPE